MTAEIPHNILDAKFTRRQLLQSAGFAAGMGGINLLERHFPAAEPSDQIIGTNVEGLAWIARRTGGYIKRESPTAADLITRYYDPFYNIGSSGQGSVNPYLNYLRLANLELNPLALAKDDRGQLGLYRSFLTEMGQGIQSVPIPAGMHLTEGGFVGNERILNSELIIFTADQTPSSEKSTMIVVGVEGPAGIRERWRLTAEAQRSYQLHQAAVLNDYSGRRYKPAIGLVYTIQEDDRLTTKQTVFPWETPSGPVILDYVIDQDTGPFAQYIVSAAKFPEHEEDAFRTLVLKQRNPGDQFTGQIREHGVYTPPGRVLDFTLPPHGLLAVALVRNTPELVQIAKRPELVTGLDPMTYNPHALIVNPQNNTLIADLRVNLTDPKVRNLTAFITPTGYDIYYQNGPNLYKI